MVYVGDVTTTRRVTTYTNVHDMNISEHISPLPLARFGRFVRFAPPLPPIVQVRELSRRQEEAERKKVEQANAQEEAKKAVAAHVKQQVIEP